MTIARVFGLLYFSYNMWQKRCLIYSSKLLNVAEHNVQRAEHRLQKHGPRDWRPDSRATLYSFRDRYIDSQSSIYAGINLLRAWIADHCFKSY
jgi:hypothetical protein